LLVTGGSLLRHRGSCPISDRLCGNQG
jgi:hypothetical protein